MCLTLLTINTKHIVEIFTRLVNSIRTLNISKLSYNIITVYIPLLKHHEISKLNFPSGLFNSTLSSRKEDEQIST
jgi:hypothetical protein